MDKEYKESVTDTGTDTTEDDLFFSGWTIFINEEVGGTVSEDDVIPTDTDWVIWTGMDCEVNEVVSGVVN